MAPFPIPAGEAIGLVIMGIVGAWSWELFNRIVAPRLRRNAMQSTLLQLRDAANFSQQLMNYSANMASNLPVDPTKTGETTTG